MEKGYKNLTYKQALKICDQYGPYGRCEDCPLAQPPLAKPEELILCYLTVLNHKTIKSEKVVRKKYGNLSKKELDNICKQYWGKCCDGCPLRYLDEETKNHPIKYKKLCDDKKYKHK